MAKGEYGSFGEKIFNNWSIDDLSDIQSTFDNIRYGIDWGFYPDPFRFLATNIDEKRKKIYIYDELNLIEKTNIETMKYVKEKLHNPKAKIIADSAEPKSIQEYKNNQINIEGAKNGADSVQYGIKKMQEYQIIIDKSCTATIKDFTYYSRKKDRNGNTTNVPEDSWNDSTDMIRYILEEFTTKSAFWFV